MARRIWVVGLVFLACAPNGLSQNPLSGDPKAAKAGEYEFRINCALCHGLGARGGGRGPDLTRAQKKHAHSDEEMFQIISSGIPGTAMPANGTNGQGVGMTDVEIWQIIAYIRSQEVKATAKTNGDAAHAIRFEKQRELQGVRRHVDPVLRGVVARRGVVGAADGFQFRIEHAVRRVCRTHGGTAVVAAWPQPSGRRRSLGRAHERRPPEV